MHQPPGMKSLRMRPCWWTFIFALAFSHFGLCWYTFGCISVSSFVSACECVPLSSLLPPLSSLLSPPSSLVFLFVSPVHTYIYICVCVRNPESKGKAGGPWTHRWHGPTKTHLCSRENVPASEMARWPSQKPPKPTCHDMT